MTEFLWAIIWIASGMLMGWLIAFYFYFQSLDEVENKLDQLRFTLAELKREAQEEQDADWWKQNFQKED